MWKFSKFLETLYAVAASLSMHFPPWYRRNWTFQMLVRRWGRRKTPHYKNVPNLMVWLFYYPCINKNVPYPFFINHNKFQHHSSIFQAKNPNPKSKKNIHIPPHPKVHYIVVTSHNKPVWAGTYCSSAAYSSSFWTGLG